MEDRFDRLQQLFLEAIDLPQTQQQRYLQTACGEDIALLAEVQNLLNSDAEAHTKIGETMGDFAAPLIQEWENIYPDAKDYIGKTLGYYRIVKRIGRGGMGTVFLGERTDAFRRKGAVKILRRGMDTADILHRFKTEQQILATLNHTNIAKLLDAGVTDDGLPYFILEYIEGTSINQYCDENALPIMERLRLFQEVCQAVQFAHQNLIVHRDLKPGNIMVTPKGEVKLLDFGIAKVLSPQKIEVSEWKTQADLRLLTPEYASPEQLRGEAMTTASDIYQLGILLYVLLCGHHPFPHRKSKRYDQRLDFEKPSEQVLKPLEESLQDGDAVALSPKKIAKARKTTPERLRKDLKGDLDVIVSTAMQEHPQRRYASAIQLCEDIDRYLDGLPVLARPDSMGYKIAKFITRNRVSAIWGMLLMVILTGLGIFYTWQLSEQRDKAELEAEKAKQYSYYISKLLSAENLSFAKSGKISFQAWLDQSRIENLPRSPHVRAQILQTLGKAYQNLRVPKISIKLLQEAVDLHKSISPQNPVDIAQALQLLSGAHSSETPSNKSITLAEEAVYFARKSGDAFILAQQLNHLGNTCSEIHHFERASHYFQEVNRLLRDLKLPADHLEVARLNRNIGAMYYYQSQWQRAKGLFEKSLPIYQQKLGKQNIETVSILAMLGRTYSNTGDYRLAHHFQEKALSSRRDMYGDLHPSVASSLFGNAIVHYILKEYEDAAVDLQECIRIKRALQLPDMEEQIEMAWVELRLGKSAQAEARYAPILQQVLHEKSQLNPAKEGAFFVRISKDFQIGRYAYFQLKRGQVSRAHTLLEKVLAGMYEDAKKIKGEPLQSVKTMIWRTESALGACLTEMGQLDKAERLLKTGYDSLAVQAGMFGRGAKERQADLLRLYQRMGNNTQVRVFQALVNQ